MIAQRKKKKLKKKLAQFQIDGLRSYRRYIRRELDKTPNTKLKKAYRSYLQKEYGKSTLTIRKIRRKLK